MNRFEKFWPYNLEALPSDMVWNLYRILLFLTALYSFHASLFWHIEDSNLNFQISAVLFLFILFKSVWFTISDGRISLVLLLSLARLYTLDRFNLNLWIGVILGLMPIFAIILLKDEYRQSLYTFFYRVFVCIFSISSIAWVFHLLGVEWFNFPDFFGTNSESNDQEYQYIFNNYIFFVQNLGNNVANMSRFSAIFLEPGYTSIIIVFLLCIEGFDMSYWSNRALLVCLLLTLSVAGYVLGLLAYIATVYVREDSRIAIRYFGLLMIIMITVAVFRNYAGGHNYVNEVLLERLEWDSETNNISGYNRTSEETDILFVNSFRDGSFLWGNKSIDVSTVSVGYKPYIIKYGVIGLSLFMLALASVYRNNKNYYSLILFLLYVGMFARGHHVIYYMGFWLLYLCGATKAKLSSLDQPDFIYYKE